MRGNAAPVGKRTAWLTAVAVAVLLGAVAPRAGAAVTEFPLTTQASQPTGIVTGPDGNLWVAEAAASRIARVTPAGVVTEFTLPAGREPFDLAASGGLIYFTERAGTRVGRLNPSAGSDALIQGSIAEFAVPGATSAPTAIAAGPDDSLWFTENGSDEIGRLAPNGVIVEFAVPGAGSRPYGIAAGPDGALWFTERGAGQIGRITTAGVVTNEFTVPALEAAPNDLGPIATGPDGALWFVNFGADQIGRITTGGTTSWFPASPGSGLEDVTAGPDGALWFTAGRAGKIGRLSTSGVVSDYSLPSAGAGPSGIVAGPDGALWFTERFAGAVGSITTDTTPDAPPTGPQGPPGPPGADAKLVLVAFQVKPRRPRTGRPVKVRFAITEAAQVSLTVARRRGASRAPAQTVATKDVSAAGTDKLAWNGRLGGKRAKPGRYVLTVTAQSAGESAVSSLRTRLRRR